MKKLFCALLALLLLTPAVSLAEALPEQLALAAGESRAFDLPFRPFAAHQPLQLARRPGQIVVQMFKGGKVEIHAHTSIAVHSLSAS